MSRLVLETWVNIKFPDGNRDVVFIKFFIQWIFLLLPVGTMIPEPVTDQLLEGNQWPSDLIHWEGALFAKNMEILFTQETHSYFLSLELEDILETLCCSL